MASIIQYRIYGSKLIIKDYQKVLTFSRKINIRNSNTSFKDLNYGDVTT
jgi:hypothetical protein